MPRSTQPLMEANTGLIDFWCGPQYTITILLQILQDSLARYDEIMASGYDKYFKIYADYLVSNAWSALRNFMFKHGDEYFTCKITEDTTCCNLIGTLDLSCSRDAVYNGVEHIIASCYYRYFWFDAPQVEGFITNGVTNPKTILNKALGDPSVPFWNFVQRQGYPRHQ
ncbi:hypothetical protein Brms1b_013244 [Colletotrichum noveboracense]|nr:hypothetical protein COL940_012607 [Colletotrichum noveboracense]KAJ0299023.1 hypothetical protein Brms1b_013244 [Colletotrichum noveboracense]